jgi:hypothetical protein
VYIDTFIGGGVMSDFVNWAKGLFGKRAEKFIASKNFDINDLSHAKTALS